MNPPSTRTNMHMGRCHICGKEIEIYDHSTPRKTCGKICKGEAKRRRYKERKAQEGN